ncbi:MAG: hypothetical protein R3F11_10345 [Verrucomicrobiales bacterium]
MKTKTSFLSASLSLISGLISVAEGGEIYRTDFETFPVGDNQLVGTEGWLGTDDGSNVHGIDDNIVPGIGKSAFLGGGGTPSSTFVSVYQPLDVDPLALDRPIIEFYAVIAFADSSNNLRDNFYFSIYNTSGELLGAVNFDNTLTSNPQDPQNPIGQKILWYDGVAFHDTGLTFLHDELLEFRFQIDLRANTWTAVLGEAVLFADEIFHAGDLEVDLGRVSADWQISFVNSITQRPLPGNNWMLFDDWIVTLRPAFEIAHFSAPGRAPQIRWIGEDGYRYYVEHNDGDGAGWLRDLPDSLFEPPAEAEISFQDKSAILPERRLYRVARE